MFVQDPAGKAKGVRHILQNIWNDYYYNNIHSWGRVFLYFKHKFNRQLIISPTKMKKDSQGEKIKEENMWKIKMFG